MHSTKATEDAVYRAADRILAVGAWPTVAAVRAEIGGGSHSTIQQHLNQWRAHVVNATLAHQERPPIPTEVQRLFQRVWDTAVAARAGK